MHTNTADALRQLATMLDAGITPADALARLQALDAERSAAWYKAHLAVQRGGSLALAIVRSGVLSQAQGVVLDAAADSGELVPALKQLAGQCEQRERDQRATRARLGLSIAVFSVASLAVLALAVARNPSTAGLLAGVVQLAPRVMAFAALLWLLQALLRLDLLSALRWLWPTGQVLQLGVFQRWFEAVFLALLCQQLQAGRDFVAALAKLQGLIAHDDYTARLQGAAALGEAGHDMTSALDQAGLLPRAQTRTVSLAAEAAGSWDEAMGHHLSLLHADLRLQREAMLAWLPRAAYVAALLLVGPLIL